MLAIVRGDLHGICSVFRRSGNVALEARRKAREEMFGPACV